MTDLSKKSEQFFRHITEKQQVDVLFECFAALLVRAAEVDPERIHVLPKENHKRNFKHDIIPAEEDREYHTTHYFEEHENGILNIYTSRSAILDYLPEDIYTEPDNTKEFFDEYGRHRTAEEIELYREKREAQLASALRFFQPLEAEYNKVRIYRELLEIDQLANFDQLLSAFWGDYPVHNDKWKRFIRTLHLAPGVVGDQEKTKALVEYVLDSEIELEFSIDEYCTIEPEEREQLLGDTQIMGFNMNLGACVYDYLEVLTLRLKGLSTDTFFRYQDEQSQDRQLIEEIIKSYFPLHVEVQLDFSIDPTLDQEEDAPLVLGYSSRLGAMNP